MSRGPQNRSTWDSEKPHEVHHFLVVRDGVKPDWVAIWDTVEITVGRHESQDIAVREAEVSRKHCVFRQKGGVYTLEDLGSALGTKVNGHPIKVHELKSGDVVAVGSLKMKFGQTREPDQAGQRTCASRRSSRASRARRPANAESGRTMMAIDLNDSMSGAPPTLPKAAPQRARGVARRPLEELEDLSEQSRASERPGARPRRGARRLRRRARSARAPLRRRRGAAASRRARRSRPPLAATLPRAARVGRRARAARARGRGAGRAGRGADVAAVGEKPIQVYPLTLCVKDPRKLTPRELATQDARVSPARRCGRCRRRPRRRPRTRARARRPTSTHAELVGGGAATDRSRGRA